MALGWDTLGKGVTDGDQVSGSPTLKTQGRLYVTVDRSTEQVAPRLLLKTKCDSQLTGAQSGPGRGQGGARAGSGRAKLSGWSKDSLLDPKHQTAPSRAGVQGISWLPGNRTPVALRPLVSDTEDGWVSRG